MDSKRTIKTDYGIDILYWVKKKIGKMSFEVGGCDESCCNICSVISNSVLLAV